MRRIILTEEQAVMIHSQIEKEPQLHGLQPLADVLKDKIEEYRNNLAKTLYCNHIFVDESPDCICVKCGISRAWMDKIQNHGEIEVDIE